MLLRSALKKTVATLSKRTIYRGYHVGSSQLNQITADVGAFQHNLKGEDSYFTFVDKGNGIAQSDLIAGFGVADGVGGWDGGVSKEISQAIMDNCRHNCESNAHCCNDVKAFLLESSKTVLNGETQQKRGSSTACVCLISHNTCHIGNIGDSRCLIFRNGNVHFESPEQTLGFNAPLQIGNRAYIEADAYLVCDPALWTEVYHIPVCPYDVIMTVTDGVTDNLFAFEMARILMACLRSAENSSASKIAEQIGLNTLQRQNQDASTNTPFGRPKPDDTTVVVAKIALCK